MLKRVGFATLVATVALGVFVGAVPEAGAGGAFDKILKEKVFNMGYIPSPPGAIKDPKTGELAGFYIDAARYVCEVMGVKPNFIETKWATFAAGLQAGQFDLSVAATFATIPRAMAVDFSRPIHYVGYSAVVKKGDARFKRVEDIDKPGIKVAVVQGAAGHEYAKQNFRHVQLVVLSTSDLTAPFVEVSTGRVDVGIEDAWATRRYAARHPEVTDLFAENPYNVMGVAWAVRKGESELLNFINTAIEYLMVNGKMKQFVSKYGTSGRFQRKLIYEPAE